ncbi:MAG TPA: DNA polymerase I [Acidimicrobiales bacterium]|nr:DNA polymerase I [Acidimicrobiales bacterium]
MATYLLLDGYSLAYRAWFALLEAGMQTSSGQQTQAVYGFVSMVTRLIDDFAPDGMAVAFDLHGPTFRDEIADDYKAGRAPMPDPLRQQIEIIRQFVAALGIPGIDCESFEADDVLGTLSAQLRDRGHDVVIVTGDRDAYQLVEDPHVKVLYNRRGVTDYVLYDEAGIKERTGVAPAQYPLLAAMRGDPSDNLPGVPGVGEKTAAKLVNEHGSIDAIFEHLDKMTPKLRQSMTEAEAQVRKNYRMTPIVRDAPIEVDEGAMGFADLDRSELERLFDFLEMRTPRDRLMKSLDSLTGAVSPVIEASTGRPIELLLTVDAVTSWANAIPPLRAIALEPSWAGTPGRSAVTGLAFVVEGVEHVAFLEGGLIGEAPVQDAIRALLGGVEPRIVGHRTKELMRSLLAEGIDTTALDLDTGVVAYLVDPSVGQDQLEDLAAKRGIVVPGAAPIISGQLGFDLDESGDPGDLPSATASRAEVVASLGAALRVELEMAESTALWQEIERPLVRVLARMEVAGVAVDVAMLEKINAELTAEAARLEGEIHALAGEPFNLNSPPQLRIVLYEKLGLKPQRKTKTGYSTDAQTLEKLRDEHPIVDTLLSYREVEKLRSTYGQGLLAEVAPDERIHASFNQTVARTGRLSSDAPNLHNIPVRTEGGRRFRQAFVPAAGHRFLVADYNQIELRVIAHLAKDSGLVAAFAEGRDIHDTTAQGVFGVGPGEVTSQMRSKAKMVSYGLAYGMEAYGLAQRLSIGVDEAAEMMTSYFAAFPNVRAYMDATVSQARTRGYTETERGRRRYLPELGSDNFRIRQAAERQAMNSGIQGLAADIFKIALVRIDRELEDAHLRSRLVLQVHDEVVLEVPADEATAAETLVRAAMETAYPLDVPLEANIAWGETWADAKPT